MRERKKNHVIVYRVDPTVRRRRVHRLRSTHRVPAIRIVLELRRRLGQGLGRRLVSDLLQPILRRRRSRRRVLFATGAGNPVSSADIFCRRRILGVLAGAERQELQWRFRRIGWPDLASAVGDAIGGGLCFERVAPVSPPHQFFATFNFVSVIQIRI